MQPYTERSANLEDQPVTNVRSNVDPSVGANVRMTVQEAAAAFGITVEAVRGRIHRGKYGREKAEDGRVYVILTPEQLANVSDHSEPVVANGHTDSSGQSEDRPPERSPNVHEQTNERPYERVELVEELRDHVAFLRAELEARNEEIRRREEEHREEARRKDTIIAQLAQRIPEIEAPRDSPPDTPDAVSEAAEPRPGTEGRQTGTDERRTQPRPSWWRGFFGFE